MTPDVLFEIDHQVAVITLNRPQKLNAVTPDMAEAIVAAVKRCNDSDTIRCVIVTGAGEKAFCAGSDIPELDAYGRITATQSARLSNRRSRR
jgi:enoyl-CoA hydratase/carnithine racemase